MKCSLYWLIGSLTVIGCAAAQEADQDDAFELSPFTIDAGPDSGYLASSTLAGTRINTNSKGLASSISVVTDEFLRDITESTPGARVTLVKTADE